jgi:simple sugar transport system substrate-binding protein
VSVRSTLLAILFVLCTAASACASPEPAALPATEPPASTGDGFVFGLVLVGPKDDQGWSEAHYRAGQYVQEQIAGSRMLVMESLNPDAAPHKTLVGVVDEMVAQGAQLILITSDDFAADTTVAARSHPETAFVHISGDHALQPDALPNIGNYYGRMMYGKMIAGCAAGHGNEPYRPRWPADQRRDPAAGQCRLPRRPLLLRAIPGRRPGRPALFCGMDRLLVPYSGRHP